jgi:hypothetical protein
MKAKHYRRICRLIDQVSPHGRRPRQQFSDATIAKVFFWSTGCDRPMSWACEADHWPPALLEQTLGTLPSQSTLSRRMRTVGLRQLIERVQGLLAQTLTQQQPLKVIDSKPLKVGSYSKDRDARRGRAAGEMARGYKLHALTCGKAFRCWTLTAMNVNDQVGAAFLLPQLQGWGYVVADNAYDANALHRTAAAVEHQLVAPPRKSNATVRDTRRNTPQRIRALDLCANPLQHCGLGESFGQMLLRGRTQVERNFGNVVMDGLHAPPPWVRRPHRVAAWVAAKLIQRMLRQVEIAGLTV